MTTTISEEGIPVMASVVTSRKNETGGVEAFNHAPEGQAIALLASLFCSVQLAEQVVAARPFTTVDDAVDVMKGLLRDLPDDAVLDSVNAHPPIGGSVEKGSLSESEQAEALGTQGAGGQGEAGESSDGADPLAAIRALNEEYRARFGYTFLIRAEGLAAGQILAKLRHRLANTPDDEWFEVMGNLAAINELRMRKTMESLDMSGPTLSTHVLDTSTGLPASGVRCELQQIHGATSGDRGGSDDEGAGNAAGASATSDQTVVENGETNADGRFSFADRLSAGVYSVRFDTGSYFAAHGLRGLYPWVDVTFRVDAPALNTEAPHLHIPLLLSPYGYSTYRGS